MVSVKGNLKIKEQDYCFKQLCYFKYLPEKCTVIKNISQNRKTKSTCKKKKKLCGYRSVFNHRDVEHFSLRLLAFCAMSPGALDGWMTNQGVPAKLFINP